MPHANPPALYIDWRSKDMGSGLKLPLVAGVVIVASLAMLAIVQGSPPTPHLFYGSVLINGEDAPVGTVISAEVGGMPQGTTTVTTAGQYGGPGAEDDKLVVSDPGTILFYVQGVPANETSTFSSGAVTELPLTFPTVDTTVLVPLVEGLNLITIPVTPETPLTSGDVMDQINAQGGDAFLALHWDLPFQTFRTQVVGTGTFEFNVMPGLGFFIFINAGGVPTSGGWDVTGLPITAGVPINFVEGLNLIGVPFSSTPYTSGQLMNAINAAGGDAFLALHWDLDFQTFRTQVVGTGTFEFDVVAGLGFFIFINTGGVPPSPFVP